MKICVIGAGAIGGLMGAKLALAGNDVTVVDQGAHLAAIQQNGLKLIWEDDTEHVATNVKAVDTVYKSVLGQELGVPIEYDRSSRRFAR